MPPGSEAPWDKLSKYDDNEEEEAKDTGTLTDCEALKKVLKTGPQKTQAEDFSDELNTALCSEASSESATRPETSSDKPRKPGKQTGAAGFGRKQKIAVHQHQHSSRAVCTLPSGDRRSTPQRCSHGF